MDDDVQAVVKRMRDAWLKDTEQYLAREGRMLRVLAELRECGCPGCGYDLRPLIDETIRNVRAR